jgi:hypothetical protein
MTNPTSDDPRELIRLAVRMGIPPAEAVRRVMDHLTHRGMSDESPADSRPVPEARSRAHVRLIHGGRGVGKARVSAQRAEDSSPTTGSSASA